MAFLEGIEHVVAVMFENRSFDHILGFLPGVNGVTTSMFNPDTNGNPVYVAKNPPTALLDPSHSFQNAQPQMYYNVSPPTPPNMQGFVVNYIDTCPGSVGADIMKCFDATSNQPPALVQLAEQFVVCDNWFSSVPGPTWPNRFYVHCATSAGLVANDVIDPATRTIYQNLTDAGVSWNIYFGDIPQCLAIPSLAIDVFKDRFKLLDNFAKDVQAGTLANYVFIEPRYFDLLGWKASDEHPPHDVMVGDALIGSIYNTLSTSSIWNSTVLVILWDEHGGTFDHVPPPNTVNPDGINSPTKEHPTDPAFDFTRLGVRTAAVIASPLVQQGVDSTQYDHSSMLATAKEIFGLPSFLTKRDAAANTFTHLFSQSNIRATKGVPATAGSMPPLSPVTIENADLSAASTAPLSDYQESLVRLADSLDVPESDRMRLLRTVQTIDDEHDAAVYVSARTLQFLDLDQ